MLHHLQRISVTCLRLRTFSANLMSRRLKPRDITTKAEVKLPYETDTNVQKHTEIYRFDNFRHFSVIKFFGITQLMFWAYLGDFSYHYLKDAPQQVVDENASFWSRAAAKLTENKYRNGITAMCLALGNFVGIAIVLFTLRSVRSVILMKGGQKAYIQTYSPIRTVRGFEVPVSQLSCMHSRLEKGSYMSLKVKGHWMYYLLDQRGIFPHPKLFDNTVGVRRAV